MENRRAGIAAGREGLVRVLKAKRNRDLLVVALWISNASGVLGSSQDWQVWLGNGVSPHILTLLRCVG